MNKHTTPIQIRFVDIDRMGHLNHATYLSYVELARLKFYDHLFQSEEHEWHQQHGLIMARTECDYLDQVNYDDKIAVYTWCSRVGNKSFELSWEIMKEIDDGQKAAAKGKTVIVCFDYKANKAMEIPADKKKKLEDNLEINFSS